MGRLKKYLFLVFCAVFAWQPLSVSANNVDVTAEIPYDIPDQAAVIDPSLDGITEKDDVVEVFGTCQAATPPNIVSIWRGSDVLGSVNCEANGTFRLLINLKLGENEIIARTSNLSEIYGPDSEPVSIFYEPPPEEVPSVSDLNITSTTPFTVLDGDNNTEIELTITGGIRPYILSLKWGDGSTESLTLEGPGTFTFEHEYLEKGVYKVVATVTDDRGVTKSYQLIVSSASADAKVQEQDKNEPKEDRGVRFYFGIGAMLFVVLFIIVFLTSFFLGRWYEYEKLKKRLVDRQKKRKTRRKKKKTTKKRRKK